MRVKRLLGLIGMLLLGKGNVHGGRWTNVGVGTCGAICGVENDVVSMTRVPLASSTPLFYVGNMFSYCIRSGVLGDFSTANAGM